MVSRFLHHCKYQDILPNIYGHWIDTKNSLQHTISAFWVSACVFCTFRPEARGHNHKRYVWFHHIEICTLNTRQSSGASEIHFAQIIILDEILDLWFRTKRSMFWQNLSRTTILRLETPWVLRMSCILSLSGRNVIIQ